MCIRDSGCPDTVYLSEWRDTRLLLRLFLRPEVFSLPSRRPDSQSRLSIPGDEGQVAPVPAGQGFALLWSSPESGVVGLCPIPLEWAGPLWLGWRRGCQSYLRRGEEHRP